MQRILGRAPVLRKIPDAPEVGPVGHQPASGPADVGKLKQSSATCGASRFATGQADGAGAA
jgi:hypothetical protein